MNNLCKLALQRGGSVNFLTIPSTESGGLGLTNPSILHFSLNNKLLLNLRHVQYALYHSEGKQQYQTMWGPLAYLNPEDDVTLRTTNYLCELDTNTLAVNFHQKVDTSLLDVKPMWEFIGLEDARLVQWGAYIGLSGVRRDTTTNGEGRMEISEYAGGKEITRRRLQPPTPSYCEKNWMPVLDQPYTYVKWTTPTEVVRVIEGTDNTETIHLVEQDVKFPRDIRGGSQVIAYRDMYIALTHEVDLYNSEQGRKDAQYYHRFIVWDKDWKIIHHSDAFKFLTGQIEFSCGMTYVDGNFIIPFGFQDSTAFVLKVPESVVLEMTGIETVTEQESLSTSKERLSSSTPTLILDIVENPFDGEANFRLAEYYFKEGHYASAMSFYLRSAEFGIIEAKVYESLLMVPMCLSKLGRRQTTELGLWQNALAYQPHRPEAHFCLAEYYERNKDWTKSYAHACSAVAFSSSAVVASANIGYTPAGAIFQKAVAAWWVGKGKESRELFHLLADNQKIVPERYLQSIQANITSLGSGPDPFLKYVKGYYPKLRLKFEGSENIDENYSQTYQDMFVLSMLNGRTNGTYLEIGAADPFKGSNSALLEKLGWTGTSVEILAHEVDKFKAQRSNEIILADATTLDYKKLLKERGLTHVDYLQVDCEPPLVSMQILEMMPFDTCTFGVITFEHDYYADMTKSIRERSREFLRSKGYVLVVSNVSPDSKSPYEDWWVHPNHVDAEILEIMRMDDDSVHHAERYMLCH